jgi:hypothetical protein
LTNWRFIVNAQAERLLQRKRAARWLATACGTNSPGPGHAFERYYEEVRNPPAHFEEFVVLACG